MITTHLDDCMNLLPSYSDNQFDIAIVDPPYFSGPERRTFYGQRISSKGIKRVQYPKAEKWTIPTLEYFKEIFRISKDQIIWGCNYFPDLYSPEIPFLDGRIIWDKCNKDSTYSDVEIAATSFHYSSRLFRYMWNGMMQGKSMSEGHIMQGNKKLNEKRIHQTQKPVILYDWLLKTYAKPGMKIIDTHGGSGSIMISASKFDIDLTWIEGDKIHFDNATNRYKKEVLDKPKLNLK